MIMYHSYENEPSNGKVLIVQIPFIIYLLKYGYQCNMAAHSPSWPLSSLFEGVIFHSGIMAIARAGAPYISTPGHPPPHSPEIVHPPTLPAALLSVSLFQMKNKIFYLIICKLLL